MADLSEILNWRHRDSRITHSGQPTKAQFALIAQAGVKHVINLGPYDNKGALEDEPSIVTSLGMAYTYIPVDFGAPSEADYEAFCKALTTAPDQPVHVHCIYNARVSAFFYRYAKEGHGRDIKDAFDLMDGIWRPGGVWATFIDKPEDTDQPNRYKGYEY